MPFDSIYEPDGIVKRLYGFVSDEEVCSVVERISSSPQFDSARYVIFDASDISGFDISQETLDYANAIKRAVSVRKSVLKIAVISQSEAFLKLAARSVGNVENPYKASTALVSSMAEARAWVNS